MFFTVFRDMIFIPKWFAMHHTFSTIPALPCLSYFPPCSIVNLVVSLLFLYFQHKLFLYLYNIIPLFPSLQYESTVSATLILHSQIHFCGVWQFCLRFWKPFAFPYFPSWCFSNWMWHLPLGFSVGLLCNLCLISTSLSSDFPIA